MELGCRQKSQPRPSRKHTARQPWLDTAAQRTHIPTARRRLHSSDRRGELGRASIPTYGDLGKAYPDVNDSRFKLLLTHNPKHWESIVSKQSNIDLTLSGHTHAMQMMLSAAGIKLSPSVWKYQHWQGLSNEDGKMLYVNIGTGEVGIPMRIGATPEITVFTLKRK